jgi:integrase
MLFRRLPAWAPAAERPLGDADRVAGPRDIQAEEIDPGDAERLHARKTNRNSLANRVLKTLASRAELDSHVTFHLSRHAAAWELYQNVGDIYKVSKFLGHSEVEQTQGYIDGFVDESRDEDFLDAMT